MKDQHLISVDELRAAGALDVPAGWRKSLGVERDLFSGLFDADDAKVESSQADRDDTDAESSSEEDV